MADPCVANSANAYRRDWVNRRKTTLNKLTALADMRHSRMLYDNIKETIAKLKQSAEGELQDLHPRRDRQARARQMVGTRSWRESLPTPWNPPPPPSLSSMPPSALAPRPRHRRRSLQPPSRPRALTMMDSLKPPTLCLDSTPYNLKQWKRKFDTYFRRSGCNLWTKHKDKDNAFFGCIEPSLETRVQRHKGYDTVRSILLTDPPTNDSLIEILDAIFLANIPLFTRCLEFWEMKQDTGRCETVETFVELLEAHAKLGDIHLMTFDEHMMFHMLTCIQDKGMLTEWRRIETPTMPEMKRVMVT